MQRNKKPTPRADKEIAKSELPRRGLGRVRFVARLESIRAAVAQGYTLRMIYEAQLDGLGIGYSQFVRYARQFVRRSAEATPNGQGKARTAASRVPDQAQAPKGALGAPSGFRYQPGKADDELV